MFQESINIFVSLRTRISKVRKIFFHTLDKVEKFDVLRQRLPADEENVIRVENILQTFLLHRLVRELDSSDSSDNLDDEDGEEDNGDDDHQADVEEVGVHKEGYCL